MKSLLCTFLLLFSFHKSFSEPSAKDTLKVVATYKEAIELSHLTPKLLFNDKVDEVCSLTISMDWPKGNMLCFNLQGIRSRNNGDFLEAINFHKKALEICKKYRFPELATMYNNIGVVYRRLDDYPNAIEYHLLALKEAELSQNLQDLATSYNSLGNISFSTGDYLEALTYFNSALNISQKSDNRLGIAINMNNIGAVNEMLKNYDVALDYYSQSYEINKEIDSQKGMAICLNDLANVWKKKGEFKKSLSYNLESLHLYDQINDKYNIVQCRIDIGELYLELKDYDRALYYISLSIEDAKNLNLKKHLRQAYEVLASIYEAKTDFKRANSLLKIGFAYRDSLLDEDKSKRINQLKMLYDSEKKESQIILLEKEREVQQSKIKHQELVQIVMQAGMVLVFLFLLFLVRNNRNKTKSNEGLIKINQKIIKQKEQIEQHRKDIHLKNIELELKKIKLTQINNEKNEMISVLAHDLRGPLNSITGLINIIRFDSERLSDDQKECLERINQTSVRANVMISRLLDVHAIESKNLKVQMEEHDLKTILFQVKNNLENVGLSKNIKLNFNQRGENFIVRVDVDFCLQICENLVSNAIKYSPSGSKVLINLISESDYVRIEVLDEGPGLSQEDKINLFNKFQKLSAKSTLGEKSTGLGLFIVKKFVDAMKGKVWAENRAEGGAKFIVEFNK
jgi:signal transduction histidine kinase